MNRIRLAAVLAAAGFGIANLKAADATSLADLNKALATAKSSGKPIFVVGGAPER